MTTKKNILRATTWQMTLMGLRYLKGRPLRTTLTTLSIVFGVALIFAINLALPSMTNAFKQSVTSIAGADVRITSVSGESFTPDSVLPVVSGVQHVQAVTGILSRQYTIPTLDGNALGSSSQIELIGLDPASAQSVRKFIMSEGRFLQVLIDAKLTLRVRLHALDRFQAILAKLIERNRRAGLRLAGGLISDRAIDRRRGDRSQK
jgi:ABC-type antimicrobial peptide transport system permease subunit